MMIDPYADPVAINAAQLQLLKKHLAYIASASPFYRNQFAAIGFAIEDMQTLDDLARLPLTGKQDLTLHNDDFLAVAQRALSSISARLQEPPVSPLPSGRPITICSV